MYFILILFFNKTRTSYFILILSIPTKWVIDFSIKVFFFCFFVFLFFCFVSPPSLLRLEVDKDSKDKHCWFHGFMVPRFALWLLWIEDRNSRSANQPLFCSLLCSSYLCLKILLFYSLFYNSPYLEP